MSNSTTSTDNISPGSEEPWPRPGLAWYAVAILLLAYIFSFIDRTILALLVTPIKADMHLSDTSIGFLHGFAFAIFYTIMGIPIGRMADRYHRGRIIFVGVALWSLMTAACGFAKTFWHLFLARIGVGVGEATLTPSAYSIISDYFPKNKLGKALGVYNAGVFVGAGLAFIVGGLVIQAVSGADLIAVPLLGEFRPWQFTFIIVGLPGVIIALLVLTIKEPVRRGRKSTDSNIPLREVFAYLKKHKAAYLSHMIGFSLLGMPIQVAVGWAPTYFVRVHGYTPGQSGLTLGLVFLLCGTGGVIAGGSLSDYLRAKGFTDATLRAGILAAVGVIPFGYAATIMSETHWVIALLCCVIFFASFGFSASSTALQLITPNEMRAQVSAIYMFVLNIITTGGGPAITALLTDYVYKDEMAVGQSMSMISGSVALMAMIILYFGLRPFRETEASQ